MIDDYITYLCGKRDKLLYGMRLTEKEKENIRACITNLSIYFNDVIDIADSNFYDFLDCLIVIFGKFYNERNNNELI